MLRVRGSGVRGLAVEESESCTVTQLMTLVRSERPRPTLPEDKVLLPHHTNKHDDKNISSQINFFSPHPTPPGWVELAFVLSVGVAVNSDDADGGARCVGDDDWLRQHDCGGGYSHTTAEQRCTPTEKEN